MRRLRFGVRSCRCEETGFTLVELLIVVMIIAILIGIAIPTFIGARKRAQDRAAQASLRIAATSAKLIYTDKEDYTQATPNALGSSEPSVVFLASSSSSTGPTEISVVGSSATRFYAAAFSKDGKCWYLRDVATAAGTEGGTTWGLNSLATETNCTADNAVAADATFVRNLDSL